MKGGCAASGPNMTCNSAARSCRSKSRQHGACSISTAFRLLILTAMSVVGQEAEAAGAYVTGRDCGG